MKTFEKAEFENKKENYTYGHRNGENESDRTESE